MKFNYIFRLVMFFTHLLLASCSPYVEYTGVGGNILSPITNLFTIEAEKSGLPFDAETQTISVGDSLDLYFKDINNSTNNEKVAATWRLQGGIGSMIINSNGISAQYIATSVGEAQVYATYSGETKYITVIVKDVKPPKNISLDSVPNSLSETPIINWSSFNGLKVEASIHLVSNDSKVLDWTEIEKGENLNASLTRYQDYYINLRGVDEKGNYSQVVRTESWVAREDISSQVYYKPEVPGVRDIDYARSKFWIVPTNVSLGNNTFVRTFTDLNSSSVNEVSLNFPQHLASYNNEIYILHGGAVYRGDGSSVSPSHHEFLGQKYSIENNLLFYGSSTGSNQGNRYYIINLDTFSVIKDIRDFESGNGRGGSVRPFKNGLYFSGETHNNAGNPLHVHIGNTSDPYTVSSMSIVDTGHVADDNSYEHTILEEIEDEMLLSATLFHNKYSFTLDGLSWSPKYFGSNELIRSVISDDISFFIAVSNSSDNSDYIYRIYKDDPDNPVIIHNLASFDSVKKMKIINEDIYIVGNSSGQGIIEVVSNLYNRPASF